MKRVIWGCLGLLLLACQSTPGRDGLHHSPFGYAAEIPPAWLVVDADDLADPREASPPALANVDPELLDDFSRALSSGEFEVFFRPAGATGDFVDNVSVRSIPGELPAEDHEVLASCQVLTETLTSAYGRPVALSVCEIRRVAERRSLYVEASGAVDGVHSLQYLIERPSGSLIAVTGTALTGTLPVLRGEIDAMVSSLELE